MNEDYPQLNEGEKKKLKKVSRFNDDKEFAMHSEIMEVNEHLEGIHESIKVMAEKEMPHMEMPEVHKVQIEGAELLIIQGKPGPKGDTPKVGIDFEQPKDGKDYVLTEKDKKEIASKIQVPIVEKEIETIIEKQPIITNEIKEVAKYEEPDQIIEKINQADGKIERERVEGLDDKFKEVEEKISSIPRGGGVTDARIRQAFKYIFHTEEPTGAINGSNTTYTVSTPIWAIIGFTLNGEQIAELPNFTFANRTITFASALPAAYSGKDFEVKYIG